MKPKPKGAKSRNVGTSEGVAAHEVPEAEAWTRDAPRGGARPGPSVGGCRLRARADRDPAGDHLRSAHDAKER